MKIQLNRKQFDEALGVVAGAAATRASLPILSHLYLEAQGDTLRLVGSDLEQWVECRIPAIVGEDGATTLPARLLTELVGSLGGEEINIETGERHQAIVTSGDSRYQLLGLPAEEYPPVPEIESPSELALPAKHFLEMVDSVEFAVSKEEARQALTGIRMEFEGDTLRLVATDTHRLAVRTACIDSGAGEPTSAIVPLKAIQLVHKIPTSDTITLRLGAHRAAFLGENAAVYTQLIEGQYPNYQRVIPQSYTRKWTLIAQDFRNALRRAYLVARSNSNKVYLRTDGEKLVISAQGDVGEATERVDLIREGDDLEIAFNARYILDVLDVVKSEGVVIELTESLRPAVFKPAETGDYLCVIMPMAL
ncbi:MAG: DNA polymerase III subunit beta [Armatimonadetes bacterium JP3_11]|jgi:DNA polymerase-3 subunit beta|nr:MAG: DNA polymerase III subunit beta [Armatimonadetes bacterium CP1_7O]OYT75232.1 MAG: DNA polymerase III subunit beta [Armatimonadetes bacterium JP3_11]RMH07051.1 MAG: DNA polymerase III subunit beta [Armatimonadota bacterium]